MSNSNFECHHLCHVTDDQTEEGLNLDHLGVVVIVAEAVVLVQWAVAVVAKKVLVAATMD